VGEAIARFEQSPVAVGEGIDLNWSCQKHHHGFDPPTKQVSEAEADRCDNREKHRVREHRQRKDADRCVGDREFYPAKRVARECWEKDSKGDHRLCVSRTERTKPPERVAKRCDKQEADPSADHERSAARGTKHKQLDGFPNKQQPTEDDQRWPHPVCDTAGVDILPSGPPKDRNHQKSEQIRYRCDHYHSSEPHHQ
jgi:hypothetical protein